MHRSLEVCKVAVESVNRSLRAHLSKRALPKDLGRGGRIGWPRHHYSQDLAIFATLLLDVF